MDQAALLTILGNLYDKLVADVAERVQQQLNADSFADSLRSDWIDSRVENRINDWVNSNLDDQIESWVEHNLDLEDAAREAVQNSDILADLIRETVKGDLTFTVIVD